MPASDVFFDTNVLLYLVSSDAVKADRAETLLADGGHISVQVLNEFASVGTRKAAMTWEAVADVLGVVRAACRVHPLTVETHDRACAIAQRYTLSFYDSLILASALLANCSAVYSENLQADQRIDRRLTVHNPFAGRVPKR
ncbi:MAG: PIN domain-containing protein [Burkholderiaceae bacterium]|nr:PIN domain-containing protein [Burkholderiaceae bacterium]